MAITKEPFLRPYQMDAVNKMRDGCILNGGVGSGKSRTSLYYYYKQNGGSMMPEFVPMENPCDLYIITTARKRDTQEWESELAHYSMSSFPEFNVMYNNKIVIDSWNNIGKYTDVEDAFFIFDEQRVVGKGAWVKSFLKIARNNLWILLSATPGDTWSDYIPVFIANGFFRNRSDFERKHVVWARYSKFPKIDRYVDEGILLRYKEKILVDMDFKRETVAHHEDIYVPYDILKYKEAMKTRWNPYKGEPMMNAGELCYVLRRIVNEDQARQVMLLEILERCPRAIIFYNFDYELNILKSLGYGDDVEIAEWNGHEHEPIPKSEKWVYLVQYAAGAEGWNCITTDTIIFFSQNYSYKTMQQAAGRTDRLNTPYKDLYYYHLKSHSSIDMAISRALKNKKKFNEARWSKW